MPRADRLTLNAMLDMPSVDHLSNKSSVNVLLDRAFSNVPAGLPPDRSLIGLFMNFTRLTDKALREYDAARAELMYYVEPHDQLRTPAYLRAIDHLENCVGAAHRAVLNAKALRASRVGRGGPQLTERQENRLALVRHSVEHADEKIQGITKYKKSPPFQRGEPHTLRLANRGLVIGVNELSYKELVAALTKMHRTIEIIRGTATGKPGPNFLNAKLRTDPGARPPGPGTLRASDYLRELNRLQVTH